MNYKKALTTLIMLSLNNSAFAQKLSNGIYDCSLGGQAAVTATATSYKIGWENTFSRPISINEVSGSMLEAVMNGVGQIDFVQNVIIPLSPNQPITQQAVGKIDRTLHTAATLDDTKYGLLILGQDNFRLIASELNLNYKTRKSSKSVFESYEWDYSTLAYIDEPYTFDCQKTKSAPKIPRPN